MLLYTLIQKPLLFVRFNNGIATVSLLFVFQETLDHGSNR